MRYGKLVKTIAPLCAAVMLTACAHKPQAAGNNIDPYEPYNRRVFAFNMAVDRLFARPVAKVYETITPPPLQKGIMNIFNNVRVATTIPNDLLQGKLKWFWVDTVRLLINSTAGIGGLFDVATRMHLPKHYEDFGLTLAYWTGGHQDPYFVLPILGPNTTRSSFGLIFDYLMSPWPYIEPRGVAYGIFAVNFVSTRAGLLDADKFIMEAFDPYIFTRDAYLQIREKMVKDNRMPYMSLAERKAAGLSDEQDTDTSPVSVYGASKWNNQLDASPIDAPPADFKFAPPPAR